MKVAIYKSDYSDARLKIVKTDDGDIVLKIIGDGEFRIATDGGLLHGEDLVQTTEAFTKILSIFEKKQNT
jgi:hypothetical protein